MKDLDASIDQIAQERRDELERERIEISEAREKRHEEVASTVSSDSFNEILVEVQQTSVHFTIDPFHLPYAQMNFLRFADSLQKAFHLRFEEASGAFGLDVNDEVTMGSTATTAKKRRHKTFVLC